MEFTRVVKEVKFIALSQGVRIHQYLDNWLVRAKDLDTGARDVQKLIILVGKLGWIVNLKKIRAQPNSGSRVSGLLFQPSRGFGLSKSKESGQTQNSGSFHFARSQYYSKGAHVTDWDHGFYGEDSSFGSNPYEAVSVVSEDQLALSPVPGQNCPNFAADKGPSRLVDGSSERTQGFESASEGTQHVDVHRCIREGLGGPFE